MMRKLAIPLTLALPAASTPAYAAPTRHEAENAACDGTIDANHSGFSGSGFCNSTNTAGEVGTLPPTGRTMESLGRGVVALRSSTSTVLVSWRLLGLDPADITFHVYRSTAGSAPVRLNASPLTGGTNFVDTTANLAQVNSYHVRPVVGAGMTPPPRPNITYPARF